MIEPEDIHWDKQKDNDFYAEIRYRDINYSLNIRILDKTFWFGSIKSSNGKKSWTNSSFRTPKFKDKVFYLLGKLKKVK